MTTSAMAYQAFSHTAASAAAAAAYQPQMSVSLLIIAATNAGVNPQDALFHVNRYMDGLNSGEYNLDQIIHFLDMV